MQPIIYLDYAATTPVDPRVAKVLANHLTADGVFANPASRSHMLGWQAEAAVENARKQVASLLSADVREIVWTSGATEANNLAIKGVAEAKGKGKHIITAQTEHKAVLDSVSYLESKGYRVTYLKPEPDGRIALGTLKAAIEPDTILISLMHVNNETGVINDIEKIGELAKEHGVLFHVDAAQSAGKLRIDTRHINVDLISVCAHKIYGPKGVGALFVKRRPDFVLPPQIHGGGHERGMRSGTLPTHQIAAMGEAFAIAQENMTSENARISSLKELFLSELSGLDLIRINGDLHNCVPNILNLSFSGIDGQLLLSALPRLAVSSGSACTSATMAPSYVLKSMGLSDELALSSLRFSFGRFTSEDDCKQAAISLREAIEKMS